MNIGKSCPLPLCTLIGNCQLSFVQQFLLSFSCAIGSATTGSTSFQNKLLPTCSVAYLCSLHTSSSQVVHRSTTGDSVAATPPFKSFGASHAKTSAHVIFGGISLQFCCRESYQVFLNPWLGEREMFSRRRSAYGGIQQHLRLVAVWVVFVVLTIFMISVVFFVKGNSRMQTIGS